MPTLISLNGYVEESVFSFLAKQFRFDEVLGVDGGTQHLIKAGVRPSKILGDLDSIKGSTLLDVFSLRIPMLISYWDKDFTDGERAVQLSQHVPIVLVGMVGDEIDHLVGNLSLLKMAYANGKPAVAYGMRETVVFGKDFVLHLPIGTTVSVLPTSQVILHEKGFKWDLDGVVWQRDKTPPISNIVSEKSQEIHASAEFFLVIKDYWNPFTELTL